MDLKKLKTIEEKVEYLLEKYPQTRSSDKILLLNMYAIFYRVDIRSSCANICLDDRLPDYGSVSRIRRKVQERREDLRAEDKIEEFRIASQEAYIEYAVGDTEV